VFEERGDSEYAASPALAELATAVERFGAAEEPERSPAEVGMDLRRLRHLIDLLELGFARRAACFADSDEYERSGSVSPWDWVRHECRISGAAAHSAITVGRQLAALPEAAAALQAGHIGFAHLAILASTASAVRDSRFAPEAAPGVDGTPAAEDGPPDDAATAADAPAAGASPAFDEQPLLQQALDHSVSRFRHDCAHARHVHDARGFLADHLSDIDWRSFEIVPCDGGVILRGRLDTVGGATLRSALEPLARRSGPEDQRRRKRRLADALIELAHHGLDAGVMPARGGQRPHLQVTASLETLTGKDGAPAGELEFSSPIPAATVQRLACDAAVTRVVFGPASAVLDVGRTKRVPSPSQRRAVHARDQGCVWPGCERPAAWTNVHHVLHWARDDGDTDIPNLVLLCYRHHWLVHEGGWNIVLTDERNVLTIPPPATAACARGPSPPSADEEEQRARQRLGEWALLHPEGPARHGPLPRG